MHPFALLLSHSAVSAILPGVDAPEARIAARTMKQAMDWSLVLLSQGIESTIDHQPEEKTWSLLVPPAQYEQALDTLRQYRRENRAWPWQQRWTRPGLLFDWGAVPIILLFGVFYWIDVHSQLRPRGVMDSELVLNGQWWRLFTAIWLHADAGHLASNATLGLLLLGLAMGAYGTGVGVLASLLSGVVGNLTALAIDPDTHRSLGASGMVMGALGLLAVQSFQEWRRSSHGWRKFLLGLAAGFMLFVLLGLSPGTDILAHAGGFIGGVVLGFLTLLAGDTQRRAGLNLACGFTATALILVTWYLALRTAS